MSFSFQKIYTLRQETPLIHFQYDQEGATLRATEVKPKLDRYLIERYLAENSGKSVPDEWWINHSKDGQGKIAVQALNYRMSFVDSGNHQCIPLGFHTDYDIFYGNTGRQKPIKGVMSEGNIIMKIVCRIPALLEFLDGHISRFFITHNFGTMQRKGFGSYVIGCPDQNEIMNALCETYNTSCCYYFRRGQTPFRQIKTIYSIMKSGINFRGYRRSLLFLYMHSNKMGNEKAWLKKEDMAPSNVGYKAGMAKAYETQYVHKHYYVRALLGTSEHIDFLTDLRDKKQKISVQISHPQIRRLKSPIFFKIIGQQIYYTGERINDVIYEKKFTFASKYKGQKEGTLSVPKMPDTFIDEFLQFCFQELNYSQNELDCNYPGAKYTALTNFDEMRDIKIMQYRKEAAL